jgi:hypothetical protein
MEPLDLVIAGCGTSAQPPADELASAPVLDDWAISRIMATLNVAVEFNATGKVSGSAKFVNGHGIGTSRIVAIDTDKRWLRTKNTLYRLGFRHADHTLIVRAAGMSETKLAFRFLSVETGTHTLDGEMTELMNDVDISLATGPPGAVRSDAADFANALHVAGRKEAAQAWRLLAVDGTDLAACDEIKDALLSGFAFGSPPIVTMMIEGWVQLAEGNHFGIVVGDPIWAAHQIGKLAEEKSKFDPYKGGEGTSIDDAKTVLKEVYVEIKDEPVGVVVIPAIGGSKDSWSGKQVVEEFKSLTGKSIPLRPMPSMTLVRKTLHAEFPYAQREIDILLTDLEGREHVRFRPTLVVGSPGCGKSRLVRRLGETMGVYVGRYDGSASEDNAIGGTARRWSTGEPCWPVSVIRAAGHANPILHVDELDKAATSTRNGSTAHALLPMIEVETAKRYPDPFIQADIDISHVSYLLTVNDDSMLPAPLKDRLRIIRMPNMGREDVRTVANSIVADILKDRGLDYQWFSGLDGDEAEIARRMLGDGSIRRLRVVVERLIALRDSRAARH